MPSSFMASITLRRSSKTVRSTPVRLDKSLTEKLDHRDTGDGLRMLERKKHASRAALIRRGCSDVLAAIQDSAFGDLVTGVTHEHRGQSRLTRAIGPHRPRGSHRDQRSDRRQAQDLHVLRRSMQVLYLEEGGGVAHEVNGICTMGVGEMRIT